MSDLISMAAAVNKQAGISEYKIGEDTYHIKLLPSIEAWDIAEDIGELVFPVLGAIFDGEEGLGEDQWLNVGLLLSNSLKDLGIKNKAVKLLAGATKNGESLDIVTGFVGARGLKDLVELTTFALKENVLDFLFEWLEEKGLSIHSTTTLKKLQEQILKESAN